MAKSLLHMISNDIGQLACLYARLHNLTRVYFGGFFIRGHPVTMHTITYSINFFTKVTLISFILRLNSPCYCLLWYRLCKMLWRYRWSCANTCCPSWSRLIRSVLWLYFTLQGEVQALFLRHEGYLGAIGAFLKGAEEDSKLFLETQRVSLTVWSK